MKRKLIYLIVLMTIGIVFLALLSKLPVINQVSNNENIILDDPEDIETDNSSEVSIYLDKQNYSLGEEMKIKFTNNTTSAIPFTPSVDLLGINGQWSLFQSIECRCDTSCSPQTLDPGDTLETTIKLKRCDPFTENTDNFPIGSYRIKFEVIDYSSGKVKIYSDEFKIIP